MKWQDLLIDGYQRVPAFLEEVVRDGHHQHGQGCFHDYSKGDRNNQPESHHMMHIHRIDQLGQLGPDIQEGKGEYYRHFE